MSGKCDNTATSGFVSVIVPPIHWFFDHLHAAAPILLLVVPISIFVVPLIKANGFQGFSGRDTGLLIGFAIGAIMIPVVGWLMRRRLSRVRYIADQLTEVWGAKPEEFMIQEALGRRPQGSDLLLFQQLARAMSAKGMRGRVFRLGYSVPLTNISPLDVSFEPRILDESDATFVELMDAIDGERGGGTGGLERIDRQTGRNVRRTINLMGGRWVLLALAFPLLMQIIESYRERRVSLGLVVFSMPFLLLMFGSPGSNWRFPHAHFLPGGIVLAAGSMKPKRKARLRLMSRDRCVLFVIQRQATLWEVIVSDGEDIGVARATLAEATVLLRAWLSPIAVPPEELVVNMIYQNKRAKSRS